VTTQERKDRIERLAHDILERICTEPTSVEEIVAMIDAVFPAADGRNAAGQVVEYLQSNDAGQKFNLTKLDVIGVTSGGANGWMFLGTGKLTFPTQAAVVENHSQMIDVAQTTVTNTKP